ncbi:hypothetical protein IMZ48_48620 [Candidatus Bathyarchaeota archaeon]|nr:hypothetical protein [Candidatus Bathyarchaeota archaeon]
MGCFRYRAIPGAPLRKLGNHHHIIHPRLPPFLSCALKPQQASFLNEGRP